MINNFFFFFNIVYKQFSAFDDERKSLEITSNYRTNNKLTKFIDLQKTLFNFIKFVKNNSFKM